MHYTLEILQTKIKYGQKYKKNLEKAIKYIAPDNKCNFDDWDCVGREIDHEDYDYEGCCCGHTIRYEFRIKHIVSGDTMEIGSQCIGYFNEVARSKRNNFAGCWTWNN